MRRRWRRRTADRLAVAAWCVALAGCLTPTVPGPEPIAWEGTFVHEPSGFVFPPAFDAFERVSIHRFDADGRDVGVGYDLDTTLKIALTLYVTPPARWPTGEPLTLREQFEAEQATIVHLHPRVTARAGWTPGPTCNGASEPRYAVAFRYDEHFAGARRLVTSVLYLFEYDGWVVKYRATFAAFQEQPAHAVVERFVATFPWRGAARDHPGARNA